MKRRRGRLVFSALNVASCIGIWLALGLRYEDLGALRALGAATAIALGCASFWTLMELVTVGIEP